MMKWSTKTYSNNQKKSIKGKQHLNQQTKDIYKSNHIDD